MASARWLSKLSSWRPLLSSSITEQVQQLADKFIKELPTTEMLGVHLMSLHTESEAGTVREAVLRGVSAWHQTGALSGVWHLALPITRQSVPSLSHWILQHAPRPKDLRRYSVGSLFPDDGHYLLLIENMEALTRSATADLHQLALESHGWGNFFILGLTRDQQQSE